jgi:NAD+ kinase
MSLAFHKIAVFGRPQTPGLASPLSQIVDCLARHAPEAEVFIEATTAESCGHLQVQGQQATVLPFDALSQTIDLAIVLGGDGTLIGVARRLAPRGISVIGINQGRLGFMTDLEISQIERDLPPMLRGQGHLELRGMLQVAVTRRSSPQSPWVTIFQAPALNDAVISRGAVSRMVEVDVFVDGNYLQSLRADGLILATPTGSTAYALSANGSILHPKLQGAILVPVAPQALSSRPIVLPWEAEVTVMVNDGAGTELHCDMQALTALQDGDKIQIQAAPYPVRLLHPKGYDYYAMLRHKLHWSANPVLAGRPDPAPPTEHA